MDILDDNKKLKRNRNFDKYLNDEFVENK